MQSACYAPHAGLYLRPDGYVLPCCTSSRILGRVTGPRRQSLLEIWQSATAEETRRAVESWNFDYGCDECGDQVRLGFEDQIVARTYDQFAEDGPLRPFPRIIDFALSNVCNLQCVMCNGDLSSSIRSHREHRRRLEPAYDDRFFDELRDFLPHLERALFKGGEPFLSPEVQRVWEDLRSSSADCAVSVVTNATRVTDRALEFVGDLQMDVSVSLDAVDAQLFESIRVGAHFTDVMGNIDRLQDCVEAAGRTLELAFCLMSMNYKNLGAFLTEAERRGARATVIWVNQPVEFDLLAQQPDIVDRALAELELQAESSTWSMSTSAIWAGVLDRLQRSPREPREAGVPVALLARTPPATSLALELSQRSGVEPFRAESRNGIWVSADGPEWARWLHPDVWPGRSVADTISFIWEVSGSSASYHEVNRDDGVREITLTLSSDQSARRYVVLVTGSSNATEKLLMAPLL